MFVLELLQCLHHHNDDKNHLSSSPKHYRLCCIEVRILFQHLRLEEYYDDHYRCLHHS